MAAQFINTDTLVDKQFDQQVELLHNLVAAKSTRGQEKAAQSIMRRAMETEADRVDEFAIDVDALRQLPGFSPVTVDTSGMQNVVGCYGNSRGHGRSLILNGHIDVVPEGPLSGWSLDPYQPEIRDGHLFGRGSSDMKAGLTAKLFALRAIRQAGFIPDARVYLQSVVEEECTGNGALACLHQGYTADAVVIGEPFNEMLVTAQVGVIWFQIEVSGKPVHAERTGEGVNAIEALQPVITGLKALEHEWNMQKSDHGDYCNHPHPINLNIAEIHGGDWTSSVPSWAVLNARIAIFPGDSISRRQAEIEAAIARLSEENELVALANPRVRYHGFLAEGYRLPSRTKAEELLAQAHLQEFGTDMARGAITATTDARYFGLYQHTPALVYGPKGQGFHGFDESVDLASLKRVTKVYANFIQAWCGLTTANG